MANKSNPVYGEQARDCNGYGEHTKSKTLNLITL